MSFNSSFVSELESMSVSRDGSYFVDDDYYDEEDDDTDSYQSLGSLGSIEIDKSDTASYYQGRPLRSSHSSGLNDR